LNAEKEKINLKKAVAMMDSVALGGKTVTYLTVIAYPDQQKMIFAATPGYGKPATEGNWVEIGWDAVFELK
jgi:hypothetical protein